jgi:N-acetylglutamate synthase-like GNAT family acetyltransferase
MTSPGIIPTTWVAFDDSTSTRAEAVRGSVSLVADDELDGYRRIGPWLAGLYVVDQARGCGVGSSLVAHLEDRAAAMGIEQLYLFSAGQELFYARLGWRRLANHRVRGQDVVVMTRSL